MFDENIDIMLSVPLREPDVREVASLMQESRDSTAEETAKWKISSRKNFS